MKAINNTNSNDTDSKNKTLFKFGTIIAATVVCVFMYHFTVNKYLPFSDNPDDWATFATYFTGIVSPIIALYILKLVADSFFLQKREFQNANEVMQKQLKVVSKTLKLQKRDSDESKTDRNIQLKIDSLLRRQETCISFGDELSKLIATELGSQISKSDLVGLSIIDKAFEGGCFQLSRVLDMLTEKVSRGDYDDVYSAPDSGAFKNLILLLSQLNYLCKEILNMDLQLKALSLIFTDTVGQAFKQFAISKHNSLCHRLLLIRAIEKSDLSELFDDRYASKITK